MKMSCQVPLNLLGLHQQEELLRMEALRIIASDFRLELHLEIVEQTMNLSDQIRQVPKNDEDFKVVKMLSMRIFNSFGACVKLAVSGYSQKSAMILRDVLETTFLLDYFNSNPDQITKWRCAETKAEQRTFSPVRIRMALDERDRFEGKKRAEAYQMLSELAGHPTMKSVYMMRPKKEGDAVIGPFIEYTTLQAIISEMGKLALQSGEIINSMFPTIADKVDERIAFVESKDRWISTFYPDF